MNNKLSILFGLGLMLLTSCSSGYTIKGKLAGNELDGQQVMIINLATDEAVDSGLVENNSFLIKGTVEEPAVCAALIGNKFSYFVLENARIALDMEKSFNASATPLGKSFEALYTAMNQLNESTNQKLGELAPEEQQAYYENEVIPASKVLAKEHLDKNLDNTVGEFAYMLYSSFADPQELIDAYEAMGDNLKDNPQTLRIYQKSKSMLTTAEGMPFVDFTVTNAQGTQSLSDYVGKGKYVLVDFWASWCGPCLQETPNIVELYEKYHKKGLDILGVAVWDKPEDTQKKIEELGLPWPQIIDA
ncbi:MAG TPA: TlpA disulfide reductase family protein, partial [Bacteroidales bacterium]|nr:TlpA disulfide reductase family protein [Bacteroidales bacterium]HPL06477.1 TlpA disulfide reductase family protein [Bacteroidales bacterium]